MAANRPAFSLAPLLAAATVLAAAILWGSTGTIQAILPADRDPLAVAWLRVAIGAMTLLLFCLPIAASRAGLSKVPLALAALAGAAMAVYNLAFFTGVTLAGVGVGTAIAIGSGPIWVALYEWLLRGRRPSNLQLVGQAICITGAIALVASNEGAKAPLVGYALTALAGLSYATYSLATSAIGRAAPVGSVAAVTFGLATILMAPALLFAGFRWVGPESAAPILFLGIVSTGVSYYLFTYGVNRMRTSAAVTLTLAEPLTAWVLATLVVGEPLSGLKVAGAAILLVGLWIVTQAVAKEAKSSSKGPT
ncbi:MAG: DMT family transporter [Pseudomonadota bacterium]